MYPSGGNKIAKLLVKATVLTVIVPLLISQSQVTTIKHLEVGSADTGAKIFSIMTFSIMTFNITTFTIATFSLMT